MKCENVDAVYAGKQCDRCGRTHDVDTQLNLEGHIHHKLGFVCYDNKSCKRAQRKLKGKK